MKTVYIIAFAIILASCSKEEFKPTTNPVLMEYAEVFAAEASASGHQIDISDLVIYFDDLSSAESAGGVTYSGLVVIDSTSLNWKINPESVVFHELGHKYLHRDHLDETFPGTSFVEAAAPKSIMHSRFIYNYTRNREYYLNELFSL